jgi:hypothetical protein
LLAAVVVVVVRTTIPLQVAAALDMFTLIQPKAFQETF